MTENITFRPAVIKDLPYVKNSWLESFRNGDGVRGIPNTYYYHYEELALRKIIPRCSNSGGLIIAHEHDESDEYTDTLDRDILGWICSEALKTGLLVHYVYVRGFDGKKRRTNGINWRRKGIATALLMEAQRKLNLTGAPVFYSYRTNVCWDTQEAREFLKEQRATYLPYPKFTLLPQNWETGGRTVT